MDFVYAGHFSEFLGRSVIDQAQAIVALREFVVTRSMPTAVRWEEV